MNPNHPQFPSEQQETATFAFGAPQEAPSTEALLRMIRFASIDLNKFWVEVQSFPVFLNSVKSASVEELDGIFGWLEASSDWTGRVTMPQLIPLMAEAESRKKLLELARNVLAVRALREEMRATMTCGAGESAAFAAVERTLAAGSRLVGRHGLEEWNLARLEQGIAEAARQLEQVRQVIEFFANLTAETGAPEPGNADEAWRVLLAVETIEKMPEAVRPWRRKAILDPSQRVRLQAWQDRARPLLEGRKRLLEVFRLGELEVEVGTLRETADELAGDGLLASFKAPYREALKRYRGWLAPGAQKKLGRETGFQMAERLREWASFIELSRAFEANAEARALFADGYRGIDTDFSAAIEANAWAASVAEELADMRDELSEDAFGAALIALVHTISEEKIGIMGMLANGAPSRAARMILEEPGVREGAPFRELEAGRQGKLNELSALRDALSRLAFSAQAELSALSELAERAGECAFLCDRIEAEATARGWLKSSWAGIETDLASVEQAGQYVKFVRGSRVPETLATSFLSAHGPQRLADTRKMVSRALNSMAAVREHFQKLEAAIDGQALRTLTGGSPLREVPIVDLMTRFQRVLRTPGLLG